MSEQMPSLNISYYLDVQRLDPHIYLRFQKIPSLVFLSFFVGENHPSDSSSVFTFSIDLLTLLIYLFV